MSDAGLKTATGCIRVLLNVGIVSIISSQAVIMVKVVSITQLSKSTYGVLCLNIIIEKEKVSENVNFQ